VADTVDPFAGSYYVETMTKQMEDAVFAELEKIDAMWGGLAAIKAGYFQKELARQQYERTRAIEKGERILVGVNHATREEGERSFEIHRPDPEVERRQIEKVERLRAGRDGAAVEKSLERLRDAARGGENLVPPCLEAVKSYATHGEMCDALRDVFGVYTPDSTTTGV
jgi:methylmalonyl-CoA mutase N-terminal domain/subunit